MPITVVDFGNGPVRFYNATPHSINIIVGAEFDPSIRKWVGGHELAAIPPSGELLSAKLVDTPLNHLGSGVTVDRQTAEGCSPIPAAAMEANYIVVSAMYGVAYRQIYGEDGVPLVTIRDLVVESADNPKPRGCRGFAII